MRAPLLAAALLAAPAFAADEPPARIVASGTASVSTEPDRVEIDYAVRGEGATSDDAVRALNATRTKIVAGLAALRSAPVAKVNVVSVTPVRGRDCQRYGPPQLSTGECAITGYVADVEVEVRTAAILDAGTIVGLIGRGGGLNARIGGFYLADDGDARRRATVAALAKARDRAAAIAEGAHVRLGPLLSASDGSFAPAAPQEIVVTGARVDAPAPPPPPPPPPVPIAISPKPIETQATVTVSYAIAG